MMTTISEPIGISSTGRPFISHFAVARYALSQGYRLTWQRRAQAEARGEQESFRFDGYDGQVAQAWGELLSSSSLRLAAELVRLPEYWKAFRCGAQWGMQDMAGPIFFACRFAELRLDVRNGEVMG